MNQYQTAMVQRLEVCLSDLRKIAGWRGVELGNMLGLSRQAVSTLEKHNSRLTLAQYIAVRHLLDAWMIKHPENRTLPRVIRLALDDRRIIGQPYQDLLGVISTIAAMLAGGAAPPAVDAIAKTLLDEWEGPARKYCLELLQQEMVAESLGVTAATEPGDWTEQILGWRNPNGKRGKQADPESR